LNNENPPIAFVLEFVGRSAKKAEMNADKVLIARVPVSEGQKALALGMDFTASGQLTPVPPQGVICFVGRRLARSPF
jgi:hypothetical protein